MPTAILELDESKQIVLDEMKERGIEYVKAKNTLVFDYSQSMANAYARGFVQRAFKRFVPIALAMDPKQEIEVYIFQNRVFRVMPNVTIDNYEGYVDRHITSKYSFGGTHYTPAIKMVLENFLDDTDNIERNTTNAETPSFFGKMFGAKSKPSVQTTIATIPNFVQFYTDGDAQDAPYAEPAIIEAANHGIFWQFIGMKMPGSGDFAFLKKLDELPDRVIDNAGFFEIKEDELVLNPQNASAYLDDRGLYGKLLTEFPKWILEAKAKKLIK